MAKPEVSITVDVKPKLTAEQALVLQILTGRARGKQHYATAGAKEQELAARCPVGTEVVMPDGRRFGIVDTFKDVKLVKKMVFVDRFELQEIK